MNKTIYLSAILLLFSTYCVSQTITRNPTTIKKATEFKQIKRSIDSLVIVPSMAELYKIDIDDKVSRDSLFSFVIGDTITKTISNLLKNRYNLKLLPTSNNVNQGLSNELNVFFKKVNSAEDINNFSVEFPDSIFNYDNNKNNRYYLFTVFNGFYITRAKAKKDARKHLPLTIASVALSIAFTGIPMGPFPAEYGLIDTKLMLYDKQQKKVIYYKNESKGDLNDIEYSGVMGIMLRNLKAIYYK